MILIPGGRGRISLSLIRAALTIMNTTRMSALVAPASPTSGRHPKRQQQDNEAHGEGGDQRCVGARIHARERAGQPAPSAHAVEYSRHHDELDEHTVDDRKKADGGNNDGRSSSDRRIHQRQRRLALLELLDGNAQLGCQDHGEIKQRRDNQRNHDPKGKVTLWLLHFLGNVHHIFEADESIESEKRAQHRSLPFDSGDRQKYFARRFGQIDQARPGAIND